MTSHRSRTLTDHAGLCAQCVPWAEAVVANDLERQLIGLFAQRYLHVHVHYELRRLFMTRTGRWTSLAAWLRVEENRA